MGFSMLGSRLNGFLGVMVDFERVLDVRVGFE